PHGKVRRIALPVVAILLAKLEGGDIRHGQDLALVAAALEDRLDDALMLPCQSTEQNGDLAALLGAERPLHRTLEVTDRAAVQPHHAGQAAAFLRHLFLNLLFRLWAR